MKKIILMMSIVISVIFTMAGCSIKFSEIGSEKYYVKITEDGKKEEAIRTENNQKIVDYYYRYENIPAYNKEGEKILVNINTVKDKELKKNAYLKVSVRTPKKNEVNEIAGFEEVEFSKIPTKAQKELDK